MSQMSLFDSQSPEPKRRPPNLDFIRKNLHHTLRLLRRAERMPWGEAETLNREEQFPELTAYLPEEEGRSMLEEFRAEIARLHAGARRAP